MSLKDQLVIRQVRLETLLLDPNNPRFHDLPGWQEVPEHLFAVPSVQSTAYQRLEGADRLQIHDLRESIKTNGFIPTELIVVRPYHEGKYIVVEGNRRLAAIRGIVANAIDPENDEVVQSLQTIEVAEYRPTDDPIRDEVNIRILQGVRHIAGPKQWGGYQKAHLIADLHDRLQEDWAEISQRLALGPRVTARYYRAYHALKEMTEDEEYGDFVRLDLFSLWDEVFKNPTIRDWLGWNEAANAFGDTPKLRTFYELLVGDPAEGREPSITNPQHMRAFGKLTASGKPLVLHRFLTGEISINEAERLTATDPAPVALQDTFKGFLDSLAEVSIEELRTLGPEGVEAMQEILRKLAQINRMHGVLVAEGFGVPNGDAA